MLRARFQRHLAAAGLSLVTGTAAIGIAIAGVGPLGQVAASVRGAGVSLGRSVLSVVVPESGETPRSAPAQASPEPDRPRPRPPAYAKQSPPRSAPDVPDVQDTPSSRDGDGTALPVPPIGSAPDPDDGPVAEVDELVHAPAPQAQASQEASEDDVDVRGLAGDTLR